MARIKARLAIPVAAALCASLALSACSSSNNKASGSDDSPVTLTFWGTYGNGGNTTQTDVLNKQLIPAFEQAHPNITVNYVDIPYDSLLQKLTTGAAGGQLPDLVRSDIIWVPKFAALGVYAQLDGKMPNFDTLAQATYPGSLSTNKWKGHYYGLPLDTNTRVLITNQDALSAAGVSAPPATFADLQADAPKLAAKKVSVFADSGLQGWNILPVDLVGRRRHHGLGADQGDRVPQQSAERGDRPDARRPVQAGRDPEPDDRQQGRRTDLRRPAQGQLRQHPRRSLDGGHLERAVPLVQADLLARYRPARAARSAWSAARTS